MSKLKKEKKDMFLVRLPEDLRKALVDKKAQTNLSINTLVLMAVQMAVDSNWGVKK